MENVSPSLNTSNTSVTSNIKAEQANSVPLMLHPSMDVRSISLTILAVIATIFMLHWASAVWIPIILSVLISYILSPLINLMQKWWIPRVIGTAVILSSIVGGLVYLTYSFSDDTGELIDSLPQAIKKFRQTLNIERVSSGGTIDKVQKAATQLEKVANETTPPPSPASGVTRVQIEKPKFDINEYLWQGTLGLAGFFGQATIVFFLTYFLIVSGDGFRRKLVKIAGPTFTKKKVTIQVLDEITNLIQRYLLIQLFTSVLVGLATWLAFAWVGLEHAVVWGITAGILNSIPYMGPIIVSGSTALVALLQFGTIDMGLFVGGISLAITSLEGYLLTPWLTGRASRMNPVVVFLSVLFWGWLWGLWGLLLGVPFVMVMKAVCDHVEDLKPVGELLSDYPKVSNAHHHKTSLT